MCRWILSFWNAIHWCQESRQHNEWQNASTYCHTVNVSCIKTRVYYQMKWHFRFSIDCLWGVWEFDECSTADLDISRYVLTGLIRTQFKVGLIAEINSILASTISGRLNPIPLQTHLPYRGIRQLVQRMLCSRIQFSMSSVSGSCGHYYLPVICYNHS